jgi:hypothetical protein
MRPFGASAQKTVDTFNGQSYSSMNFYYSDAACSTQLGTSESVSRTFALDGNTTVESQTVGRLRKEVNTTTTEYNTVTPTSAAAVSDANTNSGYGETGWALNVSKQIPAMMTYNGIDQTAAWIAAVTGEPGFDGWMRQYYQLSSDGTTVTFYSGTGSVSDVFGGSYPSTLGIGVVCTKQ